MIYTVSLTHDKPATTVEPTLIFDVKAWSITLVLPASSCMVNSTNHKMLNIFYKETFWQLNNNKATRSPEISREQVQKLKPPFLLYIYMYWI